MSVNAMQILSVGLIHSRNGFVPIGFCNAAITAAFSSGKPGLCDGAITVVRFSGRSSCRWPWPYARSTFISMYGLLRTQNVAIITSRVFHEIILMIIVSGIKLRGSRDFRNDGIFPIAGLVRALLHPLRRLLLLLAVIENRGTILCASVIVLAIERGRIVHAE